MSYEGTYGADETCPHNTYWRSCWCDWVPSWKRSRPGPVHTDNDAKQARIDELEARNAKLEAVAEADRRVTELQEAVWRLDEADDPGDYWLLREGMDEAFLACRAALDALDD